MKPELAMRLLSHLMKWDTQRVRDEFGWLRLMVDYKYDHYQGFSPGSRFLVSLLDWLAQFKTQESRQVAYEFVRNKMIYISQREMHHLVSLSRSVIERDMRRAVARDANIPVYTTWSDKNATSRLRLMCLRTLYVGLSDGARIDVFRRENEGVISNEQVVAMPELSPEKWDSVGNKLEKRLAKEFPDAEKRFERICLIDDFAGSGATLIRKDDKQIWDGKVPRFCEQNKGRLGGIVMQHCTLHVHHYLASQGARVRISEEMLAYSATTKGYKFHCSFSFVLPSSIVINDRSDPALVAIIKNYYDSSIETDSTGKNIWYGYRQGGLPLILEHNTPNNSIALLWATSKAQSTNPHLMRPLFSRRQRHVE